MARADGGQYLDAIKRELESGRKQWKRGDKILAAFGYVRRRQTFVDQVNAELEKRSMYARPPITTDLDLDGRTRFLLKTGVALGESERSDAVEDLEPDIDEPAPEEIEAEEQAEEAELPVIDPANPADLALTVSNLECSERSPFSVPPDTSLEKALTEMELHDYSQLVVASGPGRVSVKGIVSYKSIARAQLHRRPKKVSECLDESVPRVGLDEPLIGVIAQFQRHDAVLVFNGEQQLCGIVTPADIAVEFSNLASPFLVIGEIEQHLRWLVREVDVSEALQHSSAPLGTILPAKASDLTMGELQRILEQPEMWKKTGVKYDRVVFCRELDAIREARNSLMHFRDPLPPGMLKKLQTFGDMLRGTCQQLSRGER